MRTSRFQLTYCTNVHPGETLDEIYTVLDRDVTAVRHALGVESFGLGIRLGHAVVTELLRTPTAQKRLLETCQREEYSVFTVNGFPYGNFDSGRVKETVYQPDWTSEERVQYTLDIARLMTRLPGPRERTISTVAGGFKERTHGRAIHAWMSDNLVATADGLARIADETGVHIRLCLEPEPWTTLETTEDVLRFWAEHLNGKSSAIKDHLGICYDVCHQAVHFEDTRASIAALASADIHIGKIQISSALALNHPDSKDARDRLLSFSEPRFLHQVVAKTPHGILKCLDLEELKDPSAEWINAEAWRCHFHVPIWWAGDDHLSTTKSDWIAALEGAASLPYSPHLEIETYTWDVLPEADRKKMASGELTQSILAEFESVTTILNRLDT